MGNFNSVYNYVVRLVKAERIASKLYDILNKESNKHMSIQICRKYRNYSAKPRQAYWYKPLWSFKICMQYLV